MKVCERAKRLAQDAAAALPRQGRWVRTAEHRELLEAVGSADEPRFEIAAGSDRVDEAEALDVEAVAVER